MQLTRSGCFRDSSMWTQRNKVKSDLSYTLLTTFSKNSVQLQLCRLWNWKVIVTVTRKETGEYIRGGCNSCFQFQIIINVDVDGRCIKISDLHLKKMNHKSDHFSWDTKWQILLLFLKLSDISFIFIKSTFIET